MSRTTVARAALVLLALVSSAGALSIALYLAALLLSLTGSVAADLATRLFSFVRGSNSLIAGTSVFAGVLHYAATPRPKTMWELVLTSRSIRPILLLWPLGIIASHAVHALVVLVGVSWYLLALLALRLRREMGPSA